MHIEWGPSHIEWEPNTGHNSKRKTHGSLRKLVKNAWEDICFSNVWRELHSKQKDFTHHSVTQKVYSRIEFFLIQKKNLALIEDCSTGVSDASDYSYLKTSQYCGMP